MHRLLTRLLAASAFLCAAGTASAVNWPNATCPDSLTIARIQNELAACHPALGDTIGETRVNIPPEWRLPPYNNPFGAGLGGIVVGMDPIATGFDAYIQNTPGGPWSSVDVFFHGANPTASPYNIAIGDSIVVEWMRTGEFQNATQVLAPNNNFTAPNGIVRKVSSGNPLPPFFVGTTTQLNELPTNAFAEQYEGGLVKINATPTLTVARTSLTGGLGQNNAFLLVDPTAPSDSVFVDGNKLTTYPPPAVGTPILSVQGVLNQANRGYRIMIRNGNDVVANTPPNVTDAYPVSDNVLKVRFDRDVTAASATNSSNYSLASFGSIDGVVVSGADAVLVSITNGLAHGDLETITVNGITGVAAGQAMTTPQSRDFYNGLLTAEEVQRANTDSLSATPPCVDRSRFAGPGGQISQGPVGIRASMAAVVGARYGTLYYMMDPGNPDRGGVAAFAPPATLNVGTRYRLTGGVQEFFGESEFSNIIEVESLGAGVVPSPLVVTVAVARRDTCDYNQNLSDGEDYEGRFITLQNVKVVQRFPTLPTNGFHVAQQQFSDGDTIFVQNLSGVLGAGSASPPLGNMVTLTGVLHYESGSFRLCPRTLSDITDHGLTGVEPGAGQLAFSVSPNPARRARFSVTLPQAGNVEVGIFDVAGRQVASVAKGYMPAGTFSRDWAGRDDSGREVGAGVYFARLKVNGTDEKKLQVVHLGQ